MNRKNSQEKSRVLFLLPFSVGKAPSQRFRAEAYFSLLQANGHKVGVCSFYGPGAWETLYGSDSGAAKAGLVAKGFLKRFWQILFVVPQYDVVFIQREASPVGPPVVEWAVAKLWRKRLIFDFDDATWIPNNSSKSSLISWFKAFWKVKYLCKWAHTVAAGNQYLADYARQYSNKVVIIPTVIDTTGVYLPKNKEEKKKIIIGWTGSHSTLKYIHLVTPVLQDLRKEIDFTFLIIADKKPELELHDWEFLPWQPLTEISDLQKMDIGIMPLAQDQWSEGKCGFKLIQYSGLGISAVATPVGVNKEVIEHGHTGYLANSPEEWKKYLRALLKEKELRNRLGNAGREKIVREYSLASQEESFLHLFR